MDWNEQRRQDKAAAAEQKRKDADAAAERALKLRVAEDERRRANRQADKAEARAEAQQKRRDKRERRRERMQAWAKNTRPGVVYTRGTLALVGASVCASLPAQVMHFASLSLWLVTLPFALEGAAWVMAAGVAYADEKHLPAWVRWLLRGLCLTAAAYAGWINYDYGMRTNPSVGYGLAAVSLLGPLVFEIRQWITNLTIDAGEKKRRAEAKARAKHENRRRKHHKDIVRAAERLVSAAPYGTLSFEDAFRVAWEITFGVRTPGMTPALHTQAAQSRVDLASALAKVDTEAGPAPEAVAVELLLADLFAPGGGDHGGSAGHGGRLPKTPAGGGSSATATVPQKGAQGAVSSQVGSHLSPRPKPIPPKRRKGDAPRFSSMARKAARREAQERQQNQ